jgi:hypothetical protein
MGMQQGSVSIVGDTRVVNPLTFQQSEKNGSNNCGEQKFIEDKATDVASYKILFGTVANRADVEKARDKLVSALRSTQGVQTAYKEYDELVNNLPSGNRSLASGIAIGLVIGAVTAGVVLSIGLPPIAIGVLGAAAVMSAGGGIYMRIEAGEYNERKNKEKEGIASKFNLSAAKATPMKMAQVEKGEINNINKKQTHRKKKSRNHFPLKRYHLEY